MNKLIRKTIFAAMLSAFAASAAQATVYTEDFNQAFPAWESNWFGLQSDAKNYYCGDTSNCNNRGNNPDGIWLWGNNTISVTFNSAFGASLTALTLGVAAYSSTVLSAYDSLGAQIFSQDVSLIGVAFSNPGLYAYYTITSNSGIARFEFSGNASGYTSIDNLTAVTRDVPEPASIALLGLGLLGAAAVRRRAR